MSYHCTLHVVYESEDEKYTIPEEFEIDDTERNGSCRVEVYVSKKYNSLEEMLPDYHHALVVSKQEARADFYCNNRLLPEKIYKDYLQRLDICEGCRVKFNPEFHLFRQNAEWKYRKSTKCSKCFSPYECPYCSEHCLQLQDVLDHIRIQHSGELKFFKRS